MGLAAIDFATFLAQASEYGAEAAIAASRLTDLGFAPEEVLKLLRLWTKDYGMVVTAENATEVITYGIATKSGDFIGNIGAVADSTTAGAINSATVQVPVTTAIDAETGKLTFTAGMKTAGNFVLKTVIPAVASVGIGITLGKLIDSTLYNLNPDFWDSHNMSQLNPDTWNQITADNDTFGAKVMNVIFGLDPDKAQAYVSEDSFSYVTAYYHAKNALRPKETTHVDDTVFPELYSHSFINNHEAVLSHPGGAYGARVVEYDGYSETAKFALFRPSATTSVVADQVVITISASDTFDNTYINRTGTSTPPMPNSEVTSYTYDGKTVYYSWRLSVSTAYQTGTVANFNMECPYDGTQAWLNYNAPRIAWIMQYGTTVQTPTIPGITQQPDAVTPVLPDDEVSIQEVKEILQEQLPELWEQAIEQDVVQPDGTISTVVYIPIGTPTAETTPTGRIIYTTPEGSTQSDTAVDKETSPQTQQQTVVEQMTDAPTQTKTGDGETPVEDLPVGSASAMFTVYNPTQAQLNSFGSWLWNSNFVDQLKKLFNDPMQAIIGLHKVFASPTVSGQGTIKCGYLDSQVPSNIVGNQYTDVACGSVNLQEYFGNVFDYTNTKITLYLPFVGFVPLDNADVMRSTITITYHVDVLTGACLAEVAVQRDAQTNIMYTYSGNASVGYPVSSGSYMGIVSSVVSVAGSVAATVASGGTLAPLLFGTLGAIGNAHTEIKHSGSLSGNSGAMGVKTPYILISRPITNTPAEFPELQGVPANNYTTISSLTGFVRVEDVHVEGIPAYDDELSEIESLLKSGIIL